MMINNSRQTRKFFSISLITFLLLTLLLSFIYILILKQHVQQQKVQYDYFAVNESGIITDNFDKITARLSSLNSLLESHNGSTGFFETFAPECYQEIHNYCDLNLKNIVLAPKGVVQKVYPLTGNENLLGFDFMDSPFSDSLNITEKQTYKSLTVTTPFISEQGRLSMTAILPVYLSSGDSEKFWGLITLTMDFDEFINRTGLNNLTKMGINYDLWYEEETGSHVSLKSSSNVPVHPVTCRFSVQNLTWNLSIAPSSGWLSCIQIVVVFTFIILLALFTSILVYNRFQLHEANHRLQQMAYFDALTKCYSRQYVKNVLINPHTGKWKNEEAKYSLAIADIDCFKEFNDSYGHDFGDRTLAAIAQILLRSISPENGDMVIRYGGDEFILLFNDIPKEVFENKLKSIVESVRSLSLSGHPMTHFSLSIGGEAYQSRETSLYLSMMAQADQKLYQSKERGRDCYTL